MQNKKDKAIESLWLEAQEVQKEDGINTPETVTLSKYQFALIFEKGFQYFKNLSGKEFVEEVTQYKRHSK
ncbi:MAG: hypothetical protein ACPGRW_06400 [Flavobacteriaceae bacterium]